MSDERINVTDQPINSPGKCMICGYSGGISSDGRKFVDFGFDLDFYGAVIFCSECLGSIARVLGYESAEEAQERALISAEQIERLQKLEAENDRLRHSLDLLDFVPTRVDAGSIPIPFARIEEKGPDNPESPKSDSGGESGIISTPPVESEPKSILGI